MMAVLMLREPSRVTACSMLRSGSPDPYAADEASRTTCAVRTGSFCSKAMSCRWSYSFSFMSARHLLAIGGKAGRLSRSVEIRLVRMSVKVCVIGWVFVMQIRDELARRLERDLRRIGDVLE